jgi:hypothetical protein
VSRQHDAQEDARVADGVVGHPHRDAARNAASVESAGRLPTSGSSLLARVIRSPFAR